MNPNSLMASACIAIVCAGGKLGAEPRWWSQGPGPVITGGAPHGLAPANLGQAKWMARSALEALRKVVPHLAEEVEADLVGPGKPIATWTPATPGSEAARAQFSPLLIGQLKAISAPFYEHLHDFAPDWLAEQLAANETLQSGTYFPWTTTTADDANHAPANQGQLKATFSLDFGADLETGDHIDGIPDLWEQGVVFADAGATWTHINQIHCGNALAAASGNSAGPPPPILGIHVGIQIDERIAGLNAAITKPLFITQNHAGNVYVRNSAFWAADIVQQLTCISPANTTGAATGTWYQQAGVAVTPRHVLQAWHFVSNVGAEIRFVTADNQVITREIVARRRVGSTDFAVLVLDADLPGTIAPCKVAPGNLTDDYMHLVFNPSTFIKSGIPSLTLDQEEKGGVSDMGYLFTPGVGDYVRFDTSVDPKRLEFHEGSIPGDSGNPIFLLVDDQLMLISLWYGLGSGEQLWRQIGAVNATIAQVDGDVGISTGYSLAEFDLSAFPIF